MNSAENEWTDDDASSSDDDPNFEVIAEGIASTVYRTSASVDSGEPQLVVVKSSTTILKFSKEPHDIIKECRILSEISHVNIIPILDSMKNESQRVLDIWMPYIPHSLSTLLESPRFTPQFGSGGPTRFTSAARSLMLQTLSAVAYLHDQDIAHRDIKPANILFTPQGCVQLIDFGIAWKDEGQEAKKGDLWPEEKERMYFEVSTGPYRAPELLFGTRSYFAPSIDLWSLGALFAEFFTSLTPASPSPYTSSEEYIRTTLFDATRGEIGLAWSIFKILGTPTEQTWPGFSELPDAQRVTFKVASAIPLEEFLVNLPGGTAAGSEDTPEGNTAADLVKRLLVYPPEQRLRAREAMKHAWFCGFGSAAASAEAVLLPEGYPVDSLGLDDAGFLSTFELELKSDAGSKVPRTLGDTLMEMLYPIASGSQ